MPRAPAASRRPTARRLHAPGLLRALVLLLAIVAPPCPARAADSHGQDRGTGTAAAPVAAPNPASPAVPGPGPSRQPDGSVVLPKPAQRQLGVRTVVVVEDAGLVRSVELAGRVVVDPNAGGKVQATIAGRLDGGARGLPSAGQAVRKGEVLASVVALASPLERSTQAAQLAELRAARDLADRRVARLRELADTVPRKELEAADSERASLAARASAIGAGIGTRENLVAPVAGVIAATHAVAGQVVDPRELVFEVVDPTRLQIEALAYDPALAIDIAGATLAVGTGTVALEFVGAARTLREHALPLTFRATGPALAALAVGQPVTVFVRTRTPIRGLAVPALSLMKSAANQTVVWVKTAPEAFAPRVVTTEPLDGTRVVVTSGLAPGDRVATQGASLIHQIR